MSFHSDIRYHFRWLVDGEERREERSAWKIKLTNTNLKFNSPAYLNPLFEQVVTQASLVFLELEEYLPVKALPWESERSLLREVAMEETGSDEEMEEMVLGKQRFLYSRVESFVVVSSSSINYDWRWSWWSWWSWSRLSEVDSVWRAKHWGERLLGRSVFYQWWKPKN